MKSLAFLTMLYCTNPMQAEPFEVLKQLENCYDVMLPAMEKNDEAFVWLSNIPHPLFNAVMHLSAQDTKARVDALLEKIPPENPISFWLHPQNKAEGLETTLKDLGFGPALTCSVMGRPVTSTATLPYDIRPADPEIFFQIIADIFQFDELVKSKYADLMGKIETENYLIYLDGKPVCTGTLFPNGETGGIFNISTLPEYERRGCAGAMMRHLIDRSDKLKLKQLVLLSSQAAEKLYLNLGFTKAFDVEIFVR
jgi:GNAT superfamily N-acetyltransferase